MRNPYSYMMMFVLALLLAACGSQGSVANVTGAWTGQLSNANGSAPFSMSLTQTGTDVEGTLTLAGPLPVSGTVVGNSISLGVQDEAGDSIQLAGTVSGNSMSGTMTIDINAQPVVADFTATK